MLSDSLGRQFKTLRLSLTNHCNFLCSYCVPSNENLKINHFKNRSSSNGETLNVHAYSIVVKTLHRLLQLNTVRLTGGEPTLFKDLPEVIRLLKQLDIPNIKLTTNGYRLKLLASRLADAGIDSINVSLDALDSKIFEKVSGRDNMELVLDGIAETLKHGIKLKLNCTVMKGINDSQILPLFEYASGLGIPIRYIELMKMGHLYQSHRWLFFSEDEILNLFEMNYSIQKLSRKDNSTSNYWTTKDGKIFGIIANESTPFCSDCDRLRLDSFGNIYGCLSTNKPISIMDCIDNDVEMFHRLSEALSHKQSLRFQGSPISMKGIGG